jgi:hypothetical protein
MEIFKNVLEIKGLKKMTSICSLSPDLEMILDFNKVIPEPEELDIPYYYNDSVVLNSVLKDFISVSPEDLETIQEHIKNGATLEQLQELGLQYISNKVHYSHTTWYTWRLEHWGTTSNIVNKPDSGYVEDDCDGIEDDVDELIFTTSDGPIIPIVKKLIKLYPEKDIEYWYASDNIATHTGHITHKKDDYIMDNIKLSLSQKEYVDLSKEAYETYIFCWGINSCIYIDDEGNYKHHVDCKTCKNTNCPSYHASVIQQLI